MGAVLLENGDNLLLESGDWIVLEDYSGPISTGSAQFASRRLRRGVGTSLQRVHLSAATVESLDLQVTCSADPTATPPSFALTNMGTYATTATTFTDGTWSGTWDSASGAIVAITPLLGSELAITAGNRKWLWIKVVARGETAVWHAGSITVA